MMAVSKKMLDQEPSEIEMLLPFHAAGTLNARDARRVNEALASDPELARNMPSSARSTPRPFISTRAWERRPRAPCRSYLRDRRRAVRKPSLSTSLSAQISEFFAKLSPRTLAWSASLGAVLLLLQAA